MARSITNTAQGDFTTSATGAIAEILLDIITAAKYRKAKAVATAAKYGVDYENLPGEFIAKEARNKLLKAIPLIGEKLVPKVSALDDAARGQSSSDPLLGVPVHLRKLPEYQQLANPQEKAFRSRQVRSTSSPTNTGAKKPVKVKDPSLGVFLSKIADALSGSVASLNTKLDGTETAIVASKEGIGVIAKQLEENSDNVETKLDAIIDILRDQINLAKVQNDNIESRDKLVKQNEEVDQSGTFRFVGLNSNTEKTRQLNLFEENQEQGETTVSKPPMLPQQLPLDLGDGFERGGIASGPDSGYLAKLHGDEMIIPLDNNYTQGEPSAIDGKVRRPPMFGGIQKFEKGTSSPEMEEFSPNVFAKSIVPIEVGDLDEQTKKLTKATEIPTKAAGIIMMGQLQRAIPAMGPLASQVAPELSKIINPIASAFGINTNISFSGSSSPAMSISNVSADKKVVQQITDAIDEDKEEEEKSWMDRLLDPFRGLFGGGPYPAGGGPVKYERGTIVMKGGRGSRGMPGGGGGAGGGNPIMNWFNKGANTRIPNESAARFGNPLDYFSKNPDPTTLFGDDALQRGQSDINFAKGKRPSPFGRPDRALLSRDLLDWHRTPSTRNPKGVLRPRFVPAAKGGPGSAPTPITRELIKRPIRAGRSAMSGVKPGHPLVMLAEMLIGDLISPQPTAAFDQLYGPNAADPRYRNITTFEEYSAMQSGAALTPPKLNRSNQIDMQSKDQVYSKMSGDVLNLDPIVLNNSQVMNSSAPDEVTSPISTAGESDLSTYYPSLSWF
tara:strand:- start:6348 stop:8696 length:2349 start_codon:yes stop_codon:yes gene_type:complete